MKMNTILWADDDADDLQMMRDILVRNNKKYTIEEVENGREAMDYLQQADVAGNLPCLIILDINMPVLDGKETLSLIKRSERYKHIPIVVFTTSASELDRMFCQRHNTTMITKPPNYSNLEATVMHLLEFCNK